MAYKDFVSQIEYRALDTLRITVQRLISDFDTSSSTNEISHFSQKERESKHQALTRLIGAINESEDLAKDLPSTSAVAGAKQQFHLTQSARTTKDIKRIINNLLEQDKEIAQLIPKEVEGNPLVSKFREEILGELYQLIEFVLINSPAAQGRTGANLPSMHILQERLASLTNPLNT